MGDAGWYGRGGTIRQHRVTLGDLIRWCSGVVIARYDRRDIAVARPDFKPSFFVDIRHGLSVGCGRFGVAFGYMPKLRGGAKTYLCDGTVLRDGVRRTSARH